MSEVLGEVDRGHASSAQFALEYVPIRQGGRESRGHIARRESDLVIGDRRGGRIHCGPWTRIDRECLAAEGQLHKHTAVSDSRYFKLQPHFLGSAASRSRPSRAAAT